MIYGEIIHIPKVDEFLLKATYKHRYPLGVYIHSTDFIWTVLR